MKKLFTGKTNELKDILKEKMLFYSKNLLFEEAAKVRDKIYSLDNLFVKQGVVINNEKSTDIFIFEEDGNFKVLCTLFIRNGKLIGVKTDFIENDELDITLYILQFYSITQQIPEYIGIIFNYEIVKENDTLLDAIYKATGQKLSLKKQIEKKLIEIGKENIESAKKTFLEKSDNIKNAISKLKEFIGITPETIECIDISHLYGKNVVGASVCWQNGDFVKNRYRKYRISNEKNDDFSSIYELMSRKAENITEGSEEKSDLYIIDGGIGQLNAAIKAFKDKGISIPIISISKGRHIKQQKFEKSESIASIHIKSRKNPINLKRNDPLLLLIEKIRDEAHRFVINYMRKSYEKILLKSGILEVQGVGKKRLKKILTTYPNILEKDITPEDLAKTCNIPLNIAQNIINYLNEIKKNRGDIWGSKIKEY